MTNQLYKKQAIIASIVSGVLIAIGYATGLLIQTATTLIVSMSLLSLAGVWISRQAGKRQGVGRYLGIGAIGCFIEMIGILTCRPYGCFSYSDLLGPKFFGTFPLLLIGIWPFIVLSIAHLIPSTISTRIQHLARGVCLLIILDLALDPVHVIQGIWSYAPTAWMRFDVPIQNYLGRILTGSLSMLVYMHNKKHLTHPSRQMCGIALMTIFWVQFLWYALF